MLHYNRINISKGIDLTKSINSKECMICHHQLFHQGFEFSDSVCNDCHELKILNVNISDIAIINVKNADYRCIVQNISKSEAVNLLKNSVLEDHGYVQENIV